MATYATFDHHRFPLVTVAFTGAPATDESFQQYLDGLHQAYEQQQPFSYLFDASQAQLPSLQHQRMQAKWLKEHKALMQAYCCGTAYLIPNPLVRTALRAIFALQKQPVPYAVLGTEEEAIAWCEKALRG